MFSTIPVDNETVPTKPKSKKSTDKARCFRCPNELWFYLVRAGALRPEPINASELVREILENYAAKHLLPKDIKSR
jgi:hypothetical protein